MADPHRADSGSYMLRPMGMLVVGGFLGGCGAEAIEKAFLEEAAELARDELPGLLGSAIWRRLQPIALSRWASEPLIGGSYSHARPTRSGADRELRKAGDERIAFPGEAASGDDFSMAHGAHASRWQRWSGCSPKRLPGAALEAYERASSVCRRRNRSPPVPQDCGERVHG
ncbi:FAD-dependent oxidoreductase [Sphingomonas arvum]|uniref:FAD-dependent oxidoreductase n=1 Tax=Sphingomonas arvum TaxID=2992113 RepID=UPI0038B30C2F